MPKIVVVPLSLCVDTNLQRSIDAFANLGVSKFFMLTNWFKLNKLFNRYRAGDLTTSQFKNEIITLCPSIDFSNGKFEAAWNAQSVVTVSTKERFLELEALTERGIEIYLTSTTNALHHQHIEKQLQKKLPGTSYFSYQQHQFGNRLLSSLIDLLKQKYPLLKQEELIVLYTKPGNPPHANWGPLGWLFAPFRRWENLQAKQYVSALEKHAAMSKNYTLLPCNFSKKGTVTEVLQQKGWINEVTLEPQVQLNIMRHHARYSLRENPKPVEKFNITVGKKKRLS